MPQWWQICVTCFLCLSVVNICPVFLCINEKYIYGCQIVVDEVPQRMSFQSRGVCWFYCGHWFRSTLSCRALVLKRLWVSLDLVFAMFFFIFVYWHLFSFCFLEMKMGGDFVSALWFCLKILNLVFWIEDMDYLVLALFCWMHISIQHDWFILMLLKRARCVDAPCWR